MQPSVLSVFWCDNVLATVGVDGLINYDKFGDALYMIDIGQNDIADSFAKGLSYAQVVHKIPSMLMQIKNAIKVNSLDSSPILPCSAHICK